MNAPPPPADQVRPPQVTWASDELAATLPPGRLAMTCPNCGSPAQKSLVLAVDFLTPDHPLRRTHVLRCPDCTASFYDDQNPPDYAEESMLGRGRVPFYVQQGAGIWLITRPLAQLRNAPASAYMEIGCGFGFGLDYAIRTKGWDGRGIDPAGLSALGRDQLRLPIELRYLHDDDEARGSMDVVLGSEVIEHVPSPRAFVRTLRAMLKPGGVLVLTTPNGEHLAPSMPSGALVPLLSPGLHLVFQNPASLRHLLTDAGFVDVRVETDSHSLVAFASDASLMLEADLATLRASYRKHLLARAGATPPGSDVFLGFAGRALQECSNDADATGAERAWQMLLPACRDRFGVDLDRLDLLPPTVATCGLEEMARLVPLNLGGLIYARSIQQIGAGVTRGSLERRFSLAADAADALRRALGELAMEDGLTEQIGWTARAEALLCAAASGGDEAIAARLRALPDGPGADGVAQRRTIAERALVGLVNAQHYRLARDVAEAEGFRTDAPEPSSDASARDALFALGVLEVQKGGDPARAVRMFAAVRNSLRATPSETIPPERGLYWAALRGGFEATTRLGDRAGEAALRAEALAACGGNPALVPDELLPAEQIAERQRFITLVGRGRYARAQALAASLRLDELPWIDADTPPGSDARREVLLASATLDLQGGGDPARAARRFARARVGLAAADPRFWTALRGHFAALEAAGDRAQAAAVLREGLAAGAAAGIDPPRDLRKRAA